MEHFPYGKQIGKFLDQTNRQKRPQAQKPISWVRNLTNQKMDSKVRFFELFEKYMKFAHEISVQNGPYAFPNELMRFRIEAKTISADIQNTVKMQS